MSIRIYIFLSISESSVTREEMLLLNKISIPFVILVVPKQGRNRYLPFIRYINKNYLDIVIVKFFKGQTIDNIFGTWWNNVRPVLDSPGAHVFRSNIELSVQFPLKLLQDGNATHFAKFRNRGWSTPLFTFRDNSCKFGSGLAKNCTTKWLFYDTQSIVWIFTRLLRTTYEWNYLCSMYQVVR